MEIAKVIVNKLEEILGYEVNNTKKLNTLHNENKQIWDALCNFYGFRLPSYVPDVSGKQIYKLIKMGWTTEQLITLTGYSEDVINKKYSDYVKRNV